MLFRSSPLGLGEPEVGRATLAVSDVTAALSHAASVQRANTPDIQERVQEALVRARDAVAAARDAVERSHLTRGVAVELTAAPIRLRQRRSAAADVPPLIRAWTAEREVRVACGDCARPCVVHYRYRFVDGLAAREVPCPHASCGGTLTFHMPVNSFDVSVLALR